MSEAILTRRKGEVLPVLTNPATAAQILDGKQAIDQDGEVMTGTMEAGPTQAIDVRSSSSAVSASSESYNPVSKQVTVRVYASTMGANATVTIQLA